MRLPFPSRPDTHKRHAAREALKKARKKAINEEEEVQAAAVAALPPPPEGRPYVDINYRNSWEPRQYQGKTYKRIQKNLEKKDRSVRLIKEVPPKKRPFDAYYDHPDRKKEEKEARRKIKMEEPDEYGDDDNEEEEEDDAKKDEPNTSQSTPNPIKQEIPDFDEDYERSSNYE